MSQNKNDQFKRHTGLLEKKMNEGAWGEFTIILQNGFIVQSRLRQTYVADTSGDGLITQAEAEIKAKEKKFKRKAGYKILNVVDKDE